jgi:hypothetical protein
MPPGRRAMLSGPAHRDMLERGGRTSSTATGSCGSAFGWPVNTVARPHRYHVRDRKSVYRSRTGRGGNVAVAEGAVREIFAHGLGIDPQQARSLTDADFSRWGIGIRLRGCHTNRLPHRAGVP